MKTKIDKEKLKAKFFMKKEELNALRSQMTLEKYRILSEAYKLGKQIWGYGYSIERLGIDLEVPRTTVKRCLSLSKANKRTWKLIEEGKISAFQVAQITSTKNVTFQDEIVDMLIRENLSTYQLKRLKINKIEDLNKERHRIAVEQGYSRKDSAYNNFSNWISRGRVFMLLKKESLPAKKKEKLIEDLKELDKKIKIFLKNLNE